MKNTIEFSKKIVMKEVYFKKLITILVVDGETGRIIIEFESVVFHMMILSIKS
jgi:hypothetical protein